jgi:hypothetical protein
LEEKRLKFKVSSAHFKRNSTNLEENDAMWCRLIGLKNRRNS